MFVFDEAPPKRVEATMKLNSGSFVLFLDPPTVEERIADDALSMQSFRSKGAENTEAFKARYLLRLKKVIGWDGVTDSTGKVIGFTPLNLQRLLAKYPALLEQLGDEFAKLYSVDDKTVGESFASQSDSRTVTSPLPATSTVSG